MADKEEPKPICGLVMPISELDGCSESHWSEVHEILSEAIDDAEFDSNLVSNADDVGIIQKRIIQNLYDNPIVVCDVSGKNPNVMFELGLRLAFDRPTIIVKDDKTSYAFDTAPIEHLEYPRDLRFTKIVEFKAKLTDKIKKTHEKSTTDPTYTTFLKHFGEFKVAKIEKKEVSGQEFILDELRSLRSAISRLEPRRAFQTGGGKPPPDGRQSICLKGATGEEVEQITNWLEQQSEVQDYMMTGALGHKHVRVGLQPGYVSKRLRTTIAKDFPHVGVKSKVPKSKNKADPGNNKD